MHGLEAWRRVALEYQCGSAEANLCRGEDLCDNWNKKLCNRMQKLTGKPGLINNRIYCCIAIERRIMEKANAAILGLDLVESEHSGDDGDSAHFDIIEDGWRRSQCC